MKISFFRIFLTFEVFFEVKKCKTIDKNEHLAYFDFYVFLLQEETSKNSKDNADKAFFQAKTSKCFFVRLSSGSQWIKMKKSFYPYQIKLRVSILYKSTKI